jgi:hypothetical protein
LPPRPCVTIGKTWFCKGLRESSAKPLKLRDRFLNAGVASYSPSIYYKKIKYLLESGLQFDEVVLFSDTSDVTDEATSYFCIDDDPKYRAHCTSAEGSAQPPVAAPKKTDFLIDRFVVTNRVRIYIKRSIQSFLGNGEARSIPITPGSVGRFRVSTPAISISRLELTAASRDRCRTCGCFPICCQPGIFP